MPSPTGSGRSTSVGVARHELRHRLRGLGLPLVLEPAVRRRALLARTFGVHTALAVVFVALAVIQAALNGLESLDYELGAEAGPVPGAFGLALTASSAFAMASPLIGWFAAWALTFAPARSRNAIGALPIAAILFAPHLLGDGSDPSTIERAATVVLTLAATYWGVGTITMWAARRAVRELSTLGPVISRVLPVLMLTVLFFFFNAEIWQVAVKLDFGRTLGLAGVLAAMALLLTTVTNRDEITEVVTEHHRACGEQAVPLRRAERMNILLITVLVTMMQFLLVAALVFAFFVAFGMLALPDATAHSWMNEAPKRFEGVLATVPVSTALVKVNVVLAAFSALNFVATASADRSYRDTFIEPTLSDIREGLRVREAYLARPGTAKSAPTDT